MNEKNDNLEKKTGNRYDELCKELGLRDSEKSIYDDLARNEEIGEEVKNYVARESRKIEFMNDDTLKRLQSYDHSPKTNLTKVIMCSSHHYSDCQQDLTQDTITRATFKDNKLLEEESKTGKPELPGWLAQIYKQGR